MGQSNKRSGTDALTLLKDSDASEALNSVY
jgi:hypothetical protein